MWSTPGPSRHPTLLDGHHRAAAATARGDHSLAFQWVDRDEAELLEVARRANTAHGLPLTRVERRHGVDKLIELRPTWSNRRIADAGGVSDATVRRRRQALAAQDSTCPRSPTAHLDNLRVGGDGKRYLPQRVDLVALMRAHPSASDRQIARLAHCLPTPVATWRRRQVNPQTERLTSAGERPWGLAGVACRLLAWVRSHLHGRPRPTR